MMTIDQRGNYDLDLLATAFARLGRTSRPAEGAGPAARYLAAARRRFYFECVDDDRARPPSRSGPRSASSTGSPGRGELEAEAARACRRRSTGARDFPTRRSSDGGLALATRDVPGGTIRSYRLFPRSVAVAVRRGLARRAATWRASRTAWS